MHVAKSRFVVVITLALSGCSGAPQSQFVAAPDDAGAQNPYASEAPGFGDAGAAPDSGVGKMVFYANDDTRLFSIDPLAVDAPMVLVGDLDCVGPGRPTSVMTDVAVSNRGKIFGVSPAAVWPLSIQGKVVHCEVKWPLPLDTHFNGLTFAPENTVATEEVLIAANARGELYRIDPNAGLPTLVGTLGTDPETGKPWSLSGDIVFLANNNNPIGFATVRTCTTETSCVQTDTLIEVDVKAIKPGAQSVLKSIRGKIVRGSWCTTVTTSTRTSFGSIFGIVAYDDHVYGFSRRGDFLDIKNADGTACPLKSDATLAYAGAGITTIAPAKAPPPK